MPSSPFTFEGFSSSPAPSLSLCIVSAPFTLLRSFGSPWEQLLQVTSVTEVPAGDDYACTAVCPEETPIAPLPKVHSLLSIPQ